MTSPNFCGKQIWQMLNGFITCFEFSITLGSVNTKSLLPSAITEKHNFFATMSGAPWNINDFKAYDILILEKSFGFFCSPEGKLPASQIFEITFSQGIHQSLGPLVFMELQGTLGCNPIIEKIILQNAVIMWVRTCIASFSTGFNCEQLCHLLSLPRILGHAYVILE